MKEASFRRRNNAAPHHAVHFHGGDAFTLTPAAFAQTLLVRIVERQDTKTELTADIPDQADAKASKSASGEKKTGSTEKGPDKADKATQTRSYTVTGATLTLQLPDRRLVRVTCESSTRCGSITSIGAAAGRRRRTKSPRNSTVTKRN